jgi:hypothetical protein
MADRVINVLTPATVFDLISLAEMKILIGIPPTDTTQDAVLQEYITQYSDVISTVCNRVFAYEKVSEIWRCVNYDDLNAMKRLFVSHYPIDKTAAITVESPTGSTLDPSTYVVEAKSGKIELLQTSSEPITVTYSGGYVVPTATPPALKQAAALMVREGQALMNRLAVIGIRSISHKDSRVMYFDATQQGKGLSVQGIIGGAVNSLLMHYVRLEV